jgi:hypothetical protein
MVEATDNVGQRDRSPAFPSVSLETALRRLGEFEAHFKRSSARPEKIGEAWGIKAKSYADRLAAALRYFGLLEYQGAGAARQIVVSDEGRKYLRAQQEETKREVIKAAALRPKQIAHFWNLWGVDRPANPACLDDLVLKSGFSEVGAREFLKVYDATIAYAGLSDSDKITANSGIEAGAASEMDDMDNGDKGESPPPFVPPPPPPVQRQKAKLMEGERELTTGLLSKRASFRLIVTGHVGEKEIERLIKKLELDKEILADASNDDDSEDDEAAN